MTSQKSVKFADEAPKKAWQDALNTSTKAMSFLLSTGMLSDITFAVGPEGKQFRVHRLILAIRSPAFEEMLVSDPRYSSCDDVIPIRDDPVAGFQWLMQHIYSDKKDIDSMDLALQVLGLAEKYMVASAYDCSIRYLQTSLRRNNVLALYRHLILTGSDNDHLMTMCRKIFSSNGNSVLLSMWLHKLPSKALSQLLREDLSVTSEVVIFKALLSWTKAQLKAKGHPVNKANIRREIDPFINDVRFFTMTSDEFVQNVLVADVLTSDEIVIALKHIARPDTQIDTTELLNDGIKLCPSRKPRTQLISKDRTQVCPCDGITRSWLKRSSYEFHMTTSDNIVLLAFKLELQGESRDIKMEVFREDSPQASLGTAVSQTGIFSFGNPVHLRESVGYVVRILMSKVSSSHGDDTNTNPSTASPSVIVLHGAEHNAATFTEGDITLTLAPGVFVQSIMFI